MSDGAEIPSLPRGKPAFDQDPHRVREITERNLEAAIGREVRNLSLIHISEPTRPY